jgi:GntR family transcriptional regulator
MSSTCWSALPAMVDRRRSERLYAQRADKIAADIQNGTLKPDQALPSEAVLMKEHGVCRGMVRSAMNLLRTRELVYTIQARGTFVRGL